MSRSETQSTQTIGAFEAKTHLSRILKDAENGIETVITLRGKPVARLVPWEEPAPETASGRRERILTLIRSLRELRAQDPGGAESVVDLVRSGRR